MPRSTTSAGTERRFLGLLLIAELIVAVLLVGRPDATPGEPAPVSAPAATAAAASRTETVSDGRTVELMSLGGPTTQPLLDRVAGAMDDAVRAVTAFWGDDWPRDIVVVATASDEQFRALAGGGSDIAAATTGRRIIFAPGSAAMSDPALRIVLRHELFHYAARADTAADAPRWLTEGVADFVARPQAPRPGPQRAAEIATLPSDADLDTIGPTRTLAYDRAWWFTRFVADRYGTQTLRRLYERACGPAHPDVETAVSETLGADLDEVLVDSAALAISDSLTAMTRVLLVTNDFPPRRGGIQSYLQELVGQLLQSGNDYSLTVYAPKWKGCEEFDEEARATGYDVVRHPTTLMLPGPGVDDRMRRLIADHDVDTVWFGAAAPLALLASRARSAGARRVVASTHGHEVGWSMLPLARNALRRIGDDADVVTYVSAYTRGRFASAFGPHAALEYVPPGVDTDRFAPDQAAREEMRSRYGLGDRPVVVCLSRLVPRKGQDMLIRALPAIRGRVEGATLVIVGGGPYMATLQRLARESGVNEHVVFTGGVPGAELPAHHAMADVFAMPCRTRGAGLDVEGLGIVFLEASSTGVPVVAGDSGGAPETVLDGETGRVVNGNDVDEIAAAVGDILADPQRAAEMGAAGRRWAVDNWQWRSQAGRLHRQLTG